MKNIKWVLAALVLALATNAVAGNDNANPCGNNGNNCNPQGGAGGDATANAGAIAVAGAAAGANASVGDIRNTNTANGGAVIGSGNSNNDNTNIAVGGEGGKGGTGIAFGGSAHQGQSQGQGQDQAQKQGQSQSNIGLNSQGQSQSTDASSQNSNDNRSSAAGNSTSVGGQSVSFNSTYVAKRNAPSAYAPSVYPTASCQKSVSLGFSSLWGGGSGGMSYSDKECQTVVLAQNLAAIGMNDTACDVLKTSDTWKRAVAADPNLANVSCRVPAPTPPAAAVPAASNTDAQVSKYKHHTVIEGGVKQ